MGRIFSTESQSTGSQRHPQFRRETNIEQSWGKGVKNRADHPRHAFNRQDLFDVIRQLCRRVAPMAQTDSPFRDENLATRDLPPLLAS